jgi:crotonobetainyl-CoA:carnitine CoA-transferase CaiB-like acyl-CoA transferase
MRACCRSSEGAEENTRAEGRRAQSAELLAARRWRSANGRRDDEAAAAGRCRLPILAGLRLVEAAAFVAAPLGGMTLAQLGADVIRIDTMGGGLDHRRWPVTPDGTSLFWTGLNKGKRSVALDLASAEGRELAMALICAPGADAGLLLTNFPPRGWLDHDALRQARADLIQLTVQGDRHGGSAVDYTVNARVGVPFITGLGADDEAVNHVLPAWDLVTGQMAATGLLAAERHRRITGAGQHLMLALEDMALAGDGPSRLHRRSRARRTPRAARQLPVRRIRQGFRHRRRRARVWSSA